MNVWNENFDGDDDADGDLVLNDYPVYQTYYPFSGTIRNNFDIFRLYYTILFDINKQYHDIFMCQQITYCIVA